MINSRKIQTRRGKRNSSGFFFFLLYLLHPELSLTQVPNSMCIVCVSLLVPYLRNAPVILKSKRLLPLQQWCDTAKTCLVRALERDPNLLLGGTVKAGIIQPQTRRLRKEPYYAWRNRLAACLIPSTPLNATEMMLLKPMFDPETWEYFASAFSYYNVLRHRYHAPVCRQCSNSYMCDAAFDAPIDLLSSGQLSVSETTHLYLQQGGIDYNKVKHLVQVDADWVRTLVHNEWRSLRDSKKPQIDNRYGVHRRKRVFQIMLRALHKQRRSLRASKSTLARCAYVALAAVVADREARDRNTMFGLPPMLRRTRLEENPMEFGRYSVLRYCPYTNVYHVRAKCRHR